MGSGPSMNIKLGDYPLGEGMTGVEASLMKHHQQQFQASHRNPTLSARINEQYLMGGSARAAPNILDHHMTGSDYTVWKQELQSKGALEDTDTRPQLMHASIEEPPNPLGDTDVDPPETLHSGVYIGPGDIHEELYQHDQFD